MATIALNASKINNMPTLIMDVKNSVEEFKSELNSFKIKCLSVNENICNLDGVISSISSSVQRQEEKVASLESFYENSEQFIVDVVQIDSNVADIINQRKDDFYDKYNYLKPDSEKSGWEKFCDGCEAVGDWCKEHWKLIVTVVLVVVAIAAIVLTAGAALGPLAATLIMVAKGLIIGAAIGGLSGGLISALTGGSFWEGFEDGAFGGAISGAITGGMGQWLSAGGKALSLGKVMFIGATAETGASLLGDIGDIAIKGENISFGEVMFNAGFSALLGGVFSAAGYGLAERFPVLLKGITSGNGSWAHVWASQSTRSLRHGTSVSLKTILKGIGSGAIKDLWDFALEPIKSRIDKWKESWDLIPQN